MINNNGTMSSWNLLLNHTNLHLELPRTPPVASLPSQARLATGGTCQQLGKVGWTLSPARLKK